MCPRIDAGITTSTYNLDTYLPNYLRQYTHLLILKYSRFYLLLLLHAPQQLAAAERGQSSDDSLDATVPTTTTYYLQPTVYLLAIVCGMGRYL